LETNESEFVFVLPDIEKLTSQKKQMTTVTLAEAQALHFKAMQLGSDHKERHRLFQQSLILFEKSIKTNPGRSLTFFRIQLFNVSLFLTLISAFLFFFSIFFV
jgi:hypothetical protein